MIYVISGLFFKEYIDPVKCLLVSCGNVNKTRVKTAFICKQAAEIKLQNIMFLCVGERTET
jgi:hypothetical protein